jgi:hypothetical protein
MLHSVADLLPYCSYPSNPQNNKTKKNKKNIVWHDFQQMWHAQMAIHTRKQLEMVSRIGSYNGNFPFVV